MASLIHGTKYEHYVKLFLSKKYKSIWLWNEIPINILHALNIIPDTQLVCDDIGCDILAETNDNQYHFIQCKNYSTIGIDNTINICDLSGFYNFMAENNFSNGIVYYSGCLSSQVLKRAKSIKYINLPYNTGKSITLTPYSYQIDAYNKLSCSGRNMLTMPCGTGKTYVSYMLSTRYKNVILLSPLISTAEQLYLFYKKYYDNDTHNICIFNCVSKVKCIDLTRQNIIVSTYDSANLIYEKINELPDKLVIIDEYHNLSINNLENKDDYIKKILICTNTSYLFMSATPHKQIPKYPHIFGNNEYILSWDDAIANKYICDYRFYYPKADLLHTKIDELKHNSILSTLEINKCILLNKAYYLLECIKELKVRKIIVFLKSITESNEFCKIIKVLNTFFNNNLVVGEINCYVCKSERNKLMSRFKNKNDTINILCNVHILDEGIDIPECDSVYLTHPNYNPINFIQRISRCNRIKPVDSGLENIAHVIIWAKDEQKITSIDKLIGEYLKSNNANKLNNPYIITTNIIQQDNLKLDTGIISQSVATTDAIYISERMTLIDYLKSVGSINSDFIDEYYKFYELCEHDKFGIPLVLLVKYLGITNQDKMEERIRNSLTLSIDYMIIRHNKKLTKGVKDAQYMLSFEGFERLCLASTTKKGMEFRDYFIMLRKFIDYYKDHISNKNTLAPT